jgi:hypothetical protein
LTAPESTQTVDGSQGGRAHQSDDERAQRGLEPQRLGSDIHVDVRRRADPAARRSVRRQASHEASAEVEQTSGTPESAGRLGLVAPTKALAPSEEPLEGVAHLGGGALTADHGRPALTDGPPPVTGGVRAANRRSAWPVSTPRESRSEKNVVRRSPGPWTNRALRADTRCVRLRHDRR